MKKTILALALGASVAMTTSCTKDEEPSDINGKQEQQKEQAKDEQKEQETTDTPTSTVSFMSNMENKVMDEVNLARQNPADYATKYLVPLQKQYTTGDDKVALAECIEQMKGMSALQQLTPAQGLAKCAQDHANTSAPIGLTSHTRADGTNCFDAMKKYGTSGARGENIQWGLNTARDIVIDLLIDAGVPNRGHRDNILNASYTHIGVGFSDKHKTYRTMCVMDFAVNWKDL